MDLVSRLFHHYRFLKTRLKGFPKKKVLVLEGGGMRGIFLVGVLQAFSERHYYPWRGIIGTSAGALIGAAYAADQIYLARDAFFSELLSAQFIRMTNIFRPEKHIMNLDWMVDNVIDGEEPLNNRRLRTTASPVLMVATRFFRDAPPVPVYLNSKTEYIPQALKASAAIPFFYRNFVPYRNDMLMDGGITDPIPYRKAVQIGFADSEILVVTTRPKGYRKVRESYWVKMMFESYYKDPQYRHLLSALEDQYQNYNRLLDDLELNHDIDVIYPPEDFKVKRLTRSEEKILEGFEQGVTAAKRYLYRGDGVG